ncbi:hypothetical protein ACIRVF_31760 [Kitasatospora sp. NPDC101157]|uniref:hypothetical protein n=1 Tax=Kitasatospora sp. NPDC101157 TaxID=3364098 RepID=UPI003815EABB
MGRQLALRYRVSRNTVAEALRPPVRKGRKTLELETGTESYRLRATKAGHHGAR